MITKNEIKFTFQERLQISHNGNLKLLQLYVFTQPLHHERDTTLGQFLKQIWIHRFILLDWLSYRGYSLPHYLNRWIHVFPKSISAKWNVNNNVLDLNSGRRFHFLQR